MSSSINDQSQFGYRTILSILGECRTLLHILSDEGTPVVKSLESESSDVRDYSGFVASEMDQWFDAIDGRLDQVDRTLDIVDKLGVLTPTPSLEYTRAFQTFLSFLSDKSMNQRRLLTQRIQFLQLYRYIQARSVCRGFLQQSQTWEQTMYGLQRDVTASYGFDISASSVADGTLSIATVGENFCTVVDINLSEPQTITGNFTQLALEDIIEDADFGSKFMQFFEPCMRLIQNNTPNKLLLQASRQVTDIFVAFLANIATQETVLTTSPHAANQQEIIRSIHATVESKFPDLQKFVSTPFIPIQPCNGISSILSPMIGTHLLLVKGVDRQQNAMFGLVPPVLGVHNISSIETKHIDQQRKDRSDTLVVLATKPYLSELQSQHHTLGLSTPALSTVKPASANLDCIISLVNSVKSNNKQSVFSHKKYSYISPMAIAKYVLDHMNTYGVYLTGGTGGGFAKLTTMLYGCYLPFYDVICEDNVCYMATLPTSTSEQVQNMDSFVKCCHSVERNLVFSQLCLSLYTAEMTELELIKKVVDTVSQGEEQLGEMHLPAIDAYFQSSNIVHSMSDTGNIDTNDDSDCEYVAQWFTSDVKTKRRKGNSPKGHLHHIINISQKDTMINITTRYNNLLCMHTISSTSDSKEHQHYVQTVCRAEETIYEAQDIAPQTASLELLENIVEPTQDCTQALTDYGIRVSTSIYNNKSAAPTTQTQDIAAQFATVLGLTRSIPFTVNWILAYYNKLYNQ